MAIGAGAYLVPTFVLKELNRTFSWSGETWEYLIVVGKFLWPIHRGTVLASFPLIRA